MKVFWNWYTFEGNNKHSSTQKTQILECLRLTKQTVRNAYRFLRWVLSCERKTTLTRLPPGESWRYSMLSLYTCESPEIICLPVEWPKCFSAGSQHAITVQGRYSASQHFSSPLLRNMRPWTADTQILFQNFWTCLE